MDRFLRKKPRLLVGGASFAGAGVDSWVVGDSC
jgi:hypothetical protein